MILKYFFELNFPSNLYGIKYPYLKTNTDYIYIMFFIIFMIVNIFSIKIFHKNKSTLVPRAGLEPARSFLRGILSPLCLPISPPGPRYSETALPTSFSQSFSGRKSRFVSQAAFKVLRSIFLRSA